LFAPPSPTVPANGDGAAAAAKPPGFDVTAAIFYAALAIFKQP